MHAVDKVAKRIRKDFCIGINLDENLLRMGILTRMNYKP